MPLLSGGVSQIRGTVGSEPAIRLQCQREPAIYSSVITRQVRWPADMRSPSGG